MVLATGFLCLTAGAETRRTQANITYRIPEGVYVNVGTDAGLKQGLAGTMVLNDGRTLVFEVTHAAHKTALLRLRGAGENLLGTLQSLPVDLVYEVAEETEQEIESDSAVAHADAEPFVPLLAPPKRLPDMVPVQNITHGSVGIQQTFQNGTDDGQGDYAVTRLNTSGDIDRLFGTAWSFIWSGNVRYRTGDGYRYHPEYESPQPIIYSAYLQHPLAGDGFARLGRFLPLELPGIGYLDGAQLEVDAGNHWSFGAAGGFKPNRVNLEASVDEPTAAAYATFEAGNYGTAHYSGTAGLLASLYQGEADRMALLMDQRAGLGPKLNLISSAEFDFGVANTTNNQSQLSRFDLQASSRQSSWITLRAGANHWQRLDSQVERDLLPYIVSDQLFDDGFWRYWIGASHELPWKLDLNEEIAYTVSDATDDAVRWRVGLTRTGLFKWRYANIGATIYNLEAQGASGQGGLLRAYFPFWDGRIAVRPSASLRWLGSDADGDQLELTYFSIYFDAMLSKAWTLSGGLTATQGDHADAMLFDLGLRYRW